MFTADTDQARRVAARLLEAYRGTGIFGTRPQPDSALAPPGVARGAAEHLIFVTLTVALSHQRDADGLWQAGRQTYSDPETRYLYNPSAATAAGLRRIGRDLQRHGLARKKPQDAQIWHQLCTTLTERFGGQVTAMIDYAAHGAQNLLALVRAPGYNFPFLKGPKIGPLWIRLLHDRCGVRLRRLEQVPLPVDVHSTHATLQTGCLQPLARRGTSSSLRPAVQSVWRDALAGGPHPPLLLDEPLDLVGQRGCRAAAAWPCPAQPACAIGGLCLPQQVRLNLNGSMESDKTVWHIETASDAPIGKGL